MTVWHVVGAHGTTTHLTIEGAMVALASDPDAILLTSDLDATHYDQIVALLQEPPNICIG